MNKRILFVDDESSILRALERLFFDSDYEIFTVKSGDEGLQLLANQPVDIVISDMRMPGMDGSQFLSKVKSSHPNVTRIILSGYADEREIFRGLINGAYNLYFFKPWDGKDIKLKIGQIFAAREVFLNPALLNIVNKLENLSLVGGIYDSISRLVEQEAEVGSIAKVIGTDPAVAAAVLRIVNSAFYNIKTGSISQAITYLGLPTVKSIVLSCSLLKSANIKVPPFSTERLARHANTSNLYVAKVYSELLKKQMPENVATAGLLHNLGLVMCLHYFPDQYGQLVKDTFAQPTKTLLEQEKASLGITHSELGGYLLNWWNIPYPIVECALFHHEPLHKAVMDKTAVSAVHIADYYAWKAVAPSMARDLEDGVFSALDVNRRDCDRLFSL